MLHDGPLLEQSLKAIVGPLIRCPALSRITRTETGLPFASSSSSVLPNRGDLGGDGGDDDGSSTRLPAQIPPILNRGRSREREREGAREPRRSGPEPRCLPSDDHCAPKKPCCSADMCFRSENCMRSSTPTFAQLNN